MIWLVCRVQVQLAISTIVVTIALIHLVWDIECRELVIALPATMVRAEKVLFEWHVWSGMYSTHQLVISISVIF